jgi:integrase
MNIVQPVRDLSQLESMKKVLKSTNIRDYAMFVVGINIGLRISDLLSLRWQDVADGRGRPFLLRQTATPQRAFCSGAERAKIDLLAECRHGRSLIMLPGQSESGRRSAAIL